MKTHHKIAIALVIAATGTGGAYIALNQPTPPTPQVTPIVDVVPIDSPHTQTLCDASLWNHVYAGDPRKFKVPQDRLKVITDCVTVTGTLMTAIAEADGDYHLRLQLDPQFTSMLNAKNISGQHGDLVLETVCSNPVTQKDTLAEGSCNGFSQTIFNKSMLGKHVQVIGAFVLDEEHGWREIHPITSITVLPK